MKKLYFLIMTMLAWLLFSTGVALAAELSAAPVPVYKPPTRGAPASRIGGGTRGTGAETPELVVLAPDHTGLTVKAQPDVYWYVSQPVATRVELTVINDEDVNPVFEGKVVAPGKSGIQRFSFAEHNVSIGNGIEYRWFVSYSPDPDNRSSDIIAGGTIQRVDLPPAVNQKLEAANEQQRLAMLAEEGVWYDMLDLVTRMIENDPGNSRLKEQRAALLKQVGLSGIDE